MKKKIVIIAIVIVVAVLTVVFVRKPSSVGKTVKKTAPAAAKAKTRETSAIPAKKTFSKGMGGLTVKIKGSNDKPQSLRIKAFSADSGISSVFSTTFTSDRMQELLPGTYDIEIDTVPAKIYKNINVSEGKETVQDLGVVTGSLEVKALNSKKRDAPISVKIIRPKSNLTVTAVMANRPIEIVPGLYNVDIETLPRQTKNDVKIEGGKETVLDLGVVSGSLMIKAEDENKKEARLSVRIKNPATNTVTASSVTNRALEIGPGEYDVDVLATPVQTKKGVKVSAGEETTLEFTFQAPVPAPARKK